MASAGSATSGLRHSFMAPVASDRDPRSKNLARTPSLPSQFRDQPSKTKQKKRTSGLFESSSDSGSDSSGHEQSPTDRDGDSSARRRATRDGGTATTAVTTPPLGPTARHHFSLGGATTSRENSANNERKGLFEFDDDAADSVETLRERVKLRQKKKETEILTLRSELNAALEHARSLDDALQTERKEKEEFAIRMNECQRIIEKRNKQLIKASERLARLAEQSESQAGELQQQVAELTAELEKARAEEKKALERQRVEYEERFTQQRAQMETQIERLTLAATEKIRKKENEEVLLHKRIAHLEEEVVDATSRIAESSEYQILLKRCDDAEAISRGLRFQLEKAQNEKKYLKKQLVAATTSSASPASMPSTGLFVDLASTKLDGNPSPASSVASADLSSFDFYPAQPSPPASPMAAPQPPPATAASSLTTAKKSSLKISTGPELRRGVPIDESTRGEPTSKDSSGDSREFVYGSTNDGDDSEVPPQPVLTTSQSDRTESTKARPGSGSINFFEKISIKFKRSATSPRNGAATAAKPDEPELKLTSLGSFSASSQSQASPNVTSPVDIPPTSGRKVLPKRPKMYVAKSLSDHEESSDSIFGSDSDSNMSSADDDDDQPPPPPPKDAARSRPSPVGSLDATTIPMPPPPPPPLFGDPSDADSSSVSDGEDPRAVQEDLRRVILPTPASPPRVKKEAPVVVNENKPTTSRMRAPSSSSDSDSEHSSASSAAEQKKRVEQTRKPPSRVTSSRADADVSSSSSSDSDGAAQRRGESKQRRHRVTTTETASSSTRKSSDANAESRKEKRDRSRSTDGDAGASAAAKVNRMNEYMEARAKKRQEKLAKKEEKESAEHKKREEYEKEWERMAQEEKERRRKQQKARRTGKRRPSSMKTVRVSQMRHQMSKNQQKDAQGGQEDGRAQADESDDAQGPSHPDRHRGDPSSDSDASDEEEETHAVVEGGASPPLPPEPTAADTDLYIRQQARLREHHEMELKKKQDADEADLVRGQIHRRVEMWSFGKELLHMILTLDQISSNEALRQCQLMVVQSPDPETLRKAYRNIIRVIHPDKLRGASVAEQVEAKELFTVLNQAFEKFKAQS